MSLQARVQILLLAIAVLIGGASAFFAGTLAERALRSELLARGDVLTRALNDAYADAVANNNVLDVVDGIRQLEADNEDISYVYFVGFDGAVVAHTFDNGFPVSLISVWDQEPVELTSLLLREGSDRYIEVRQPLISGLDASIHLGLSLNRVDQQVNRLRARIIGFAAVVILLGAIIGAFFTYRFTRPLYYLVGLFERIGGGQDFDPNELTNRGFSKEFSALVNAFVAMMRQREQARTQLSHEATHDSLTGLFNRREFLNRAGMLLHDSGDRSVSHAICFLDLDKFKLVNDTSGHAIGDDLLCQLARKMESRVRKSDTLARIGGDEFGVLLEHCSTEAAVRIAESLIESVREHVYILGGEKLRSTASIGLVSFTEDADDIESLMIRADSACYLAKSTGGDRVHVYQGSDLAMAQLESEMHWVARIRTALEDDQFCLFAQPLEASDTGEVHHYEVLLRMLGSEGELISPDAFIPASEHYNLMSNIDQWVLNAVFSLLSQQRSLLEQLDFLSVNLSGESLVRGEFVAYAKGKFQEYGIPYQSICFEITETAAIANLSTAREIIAEMRALGCRFSLDDFGSGLSSFAYLKNLPVDFLKIDGVFVKDMHRDPLDHAMVRSINEIGKVMNMRTVAEYVENDEIKGMLRALGVDYLQGYAIGKPAPIEQALQNSD